MSSSQQRTVVGRTAKLDKKNKIESDVDGVEEEIGAIDLTQMSAAELDHLKENSIYQSISTSYNVNDVIREWFGHFEELEKTDVWHQLSAADREYAKRIEQELKQGRTDFLKAGPKENERAFDDFTDPDNYGLVFQEMKKLSANPAADSDRSCSSGSGKYSARNGENTSDEDLHTLKTLTKEKEVRKQVQIDLNRIKDRQELESDEEEYDGVKKNVQGTRTMPPKDNLREETLAQALAIEGGSIDLYNHALHISKREARRVVAERQGENTFNTLDDIDNDLTDDEEFNQEIKDIALGRLQLSQEAPSKMNKFDPDDSYFSEEDNENEKSPMKDAIKHGQQKQHYLRKNKGGILNKREAALAEKGLETREQKKIEKLLRPIPQKVKHGKLGEGDEPKGILNGRMAKHELEYIVMLNQARLIEKESEVVPVKKTGQTDKRPSVTHQAAETSRLFIRNLDEGKLYTNRYVRRLKAAHKKLIDKFTMGSKYALVVQKKQIMARATRLVVDSHEKLLATFQKEALTLSAENNYMKNQLNLRNKQVDQLIMANRQLELEMSQLLKQNDYMEVRIPALQKKFYNYHKPKLNPLKQYHIEEKLENEQTEDCEQPKPFQGYIFEWEKLPIDDRVARADRRSHMMCTLQDMEPKMTNQVFDFYGLYTRISEAQKFRYAEQKVANYYKDLIQEVLYHNAVLQSQVDNMFMINAENKSNEEDIKKKILQAKTKKNRIRDELKRQKESFEAKIQEMLDSKLETQHDLTQYYHNKIDFLETELTTSTKIREMLDKSNAKLKSEIETLAKIVKTGRLHFKELENCDFDALNKQVSKYESQVAALKVSESTIQQIKATRAMRNINKKQNKTDRDEINAEAKQHNYRETISVPIGEKTPRAALKQLANEVRPRKIHEKLPKYQHDYSVEDVIADKRTQAMRFYNDSNLRVSKLDTKCALNEDSLTEPSIGKEGDMEIFHTVCHPSQTNRSGSQESKQKQRLVYQCGAKMNEDSTVSASGFAPFVASSQDLDLDKEMLLETAMVNLNDYLIDQMASSNHDLLHDQIMIDQNNAQRVERTTDYEQVKVTSFNSEIDLTSQEALHHQIRKQKQHDSLLKREVMTKQPPMTSNATPGSKRKQQYIEHFISVKVDHKSNKTPLGHAPTTAVDSQLGGMTITDGFTSQNMRESHTRTQNSPRFKNMKLEDEDMSVGFGIGMNQQSARLQTANVIIGMPRRDPLKQKVIPGMHGVLAGEKARHTMMQVDRALDTLQQQRPKRLSPPKLPQISELRFNQQKVQRRAMSIPPRRPTAESAKQEIMMLGSSQQEALKSLVNNNAFLGRGRFSQRGASVNEAMQTQPISPPSIIQVKGTSSVIQQMIFPSRGSKVQVCLPSTSTRRTPKQLEKEQNTSIYGLPLYQPTEYQPQQNLTLDAQHPLFIDDRAFSMMKLNMPNSADQVEVDKLVPLGVDRGSKSQLLERNETKKNLTRQSCSHLTSETSEQVVLAPTSRLNTPPSMKDEQESVQAVISVQEPCAIIAVSSCQEVSNLASNTTSERISVDEKQKRGQSQMTYLRKTKMATIEIQSDPFNIKEGQRKRRDRSEVTSPAPASRKKKSKQVIKKNKPVMISEANRKEQIIKEQKQNQLKNQLENVQKDD